MKFSAIVTTCNEQETIGPLIQRLAEARPGGEGFSRIVVVSSACQDRTDEIVRELAAKDSRIHLVTEEKRRGKIAAINTGITQLPTDCGIVLLSSGDVLPEPNAVEKICSAFQDARVGMAGGQPRPVNHTSSLPDQMTQLLWAMHHRVALLHPKLGELVAARRELFTPLTSICSLDEAQLEARVTQASYQLKYVPEALIHNRGPASIREWMYQRRRNAAGHRDLKRNTGYQVSTLSGGVVIRAFLAETLPFPARWLAAVVIAGCEIWAQILGLWDIKFGKNNHMVWKIARSTKRDLGK